MLTFLPYFILLGALFEGYKAVDAEPKGQKDQQPIPNTRRKHHDINEDTDKRDSDQDRCPLFQIIHIILCHPDARRDPSGRDLSLRSR
jgi:hypothetical protein